MGILDKIFGSSKQTQAQQVETPYVTPQQIEWLRNKIVELSHNLSEKLKTFDDVMVRLNELNGATKSDYKTYTTLYENVRESITQYKDCLKILEGVAHKELSQFYIHSKVLSPSDLHAESKIIDGVIEKYVSTIATGMDTCIRTNTLLIKIGKIVASRGYETGMEISAHENVRRAIEQFELLLNSNIKSIKDKLEQLKLVAPVTPATPRPVTGKTTVFTRVG